MSVIDSFNSKTVSKIIGIATRVIDYWDKENIIKPSIKEASGYGSVRLYSFTDLIQFKVAKSLRDQGISLQKIRKSLNYLRKHLPEVEKPLAQLKFLTDGDTIFVLTNDHKEIVDSLGKGQVVFSIAIEELIKELEVKASKIVEDRIYTVNVSGKRYRAILHRDPQAGGYWVECLDLPGCSSQGDSVEEALDMIRDAIRGHLEVEQLLKKEAGPKTDVA